MTFCKHESDSRCLQRFTIEPASLRVSSFSYLSYDSPNFTLSFWASSSSVQSSAQAGIKAPPLSNPQMLRLILRQVASLSRRQIPSPTNLQTHRTISGRTPPTSRRSSSYLSNSSRANTGNQAQQGQQSIISGTSALLQGNFGSANAQRKTLSTDSTISTQLTGTLILSSQSSYANTTKSSNLSLTQFHALPERWRECIAKRASALAGRPPSQLRWRSGAPLAPAPSLWRASPQFQENFRWVIEALSKIAEKEVKGSSTPFRFQRCFT